MQATEVLLTQEHIQHGPFFTSEELIALVESTSRKLLNVSESFGENANSVIIAAKKTLSMAEVSVFSFAEQSMSEQMSNEQMHLGLQALAYQFNVLLLAGIDARKVKSDDMKPYQTEINAVMRSMGRLRATIKSPEPMEVTFDSKGTADEDLWAY